MDPTTLARGAAAAVANLLPPVEFDNDVRADEFAAGVSRRAMLLLVARLLRGELPRKAVAAAAWLDETDNGVQLARRLVAWLRRFDLLAAAALADLELFVRATEAEAQRRDAELHQLADIQARLRAAIDASEAEREELLAEAADERVLMSAVPSQLQSHHYGEMLASSRAVSGSALATRLMHEIESLSEMLPTSLDAAIFVHADEERIDAWRALVQGPTGTPVSTFRFVF